MRLIPSSSLKRYSGFTSILRNASFSRGWLHLAVQSFFAVITVASFILIVMMSLPSFPQTKEVPPREPRCHATNCMLYCYEVPFYEKYKEDILFAISNLPNTCTGFLLTLHKPMFRNETLPVRWLPRMHVPIYALSIIEGNLMHFPPEAFLNQYAGSIRALVLCGLTIKTLTPNSLVGLSNLRRIFIKNSTIDSVQAYAFRSVVDTLQSLTITESLQWNPVNITGTTNLSHLTTVDFSENIFNDILNKNSFTGLGSCKILYLNSCKISAIGAGTFDSLHSIEMLFLNNNFLTTIPTGLFTNMMSLHNPKSRINLQDNLWHCDCLAKDIKQLVLKDMLLIDPICVSPDKYRGKSFNELKTYCDDDADTDLETASSNEIVLKEEASGYISDFVSINNGCYNGEKNTSSNIMKVLSPLKSHRCWSGQISKETFSTFSRNENADHIEPENSWIKFTVFIKSDKYYMIQIGAIETKKYGLLWYQSSCPNEVYCLDMVPTALRVYNIDVNAHYIFCPVKLTSRTLEAERCVFHNMATIDKIDFESEPQITLYLCTGGICLVVGAICVYALVRNNPNLLKGSKRILFVKHKNVEALVLPPKIPLRNDFLQTDISKANEIEIFTVPCYTFSPSQFNRNKSTRSSKSNAPSYVSALQPTEDQLSEWRIRNHFNNDLTVRSADFLYDTIIMDSEKIYESL